MPKFSVSKSIQIDVPVDKVYKIVSNLSHWNNWSPWLIMEPEATFTVAEDNKYYEWEGKRVGSGNMKITAEEKNTSVDYDLNFLKPWKSYAKVRFELKATELGTEATWKMDSSLPFFMFWMKKMMIAFVGMDFARGLALLKDYSEDGEVHSKLEFIGASTYPGCKFIGIKGETTIDAVGESMRTNFGKLGAFLEGKEELINGLMFAMYHKWDMVKGKVNYTGGIPVKAVPLDLPEGLFVGEIPASSVYTVRHTGPYHHLGNAWSTQQNLMRSKVFKHKKSIAPFETYVNMPGEVPENELITDIHFPTK